MMDAHFAVAESLYTTTAGPSSEYSQPSRSDTLSSSDSFIPLPSGKWIVDFHGNCPRCHHHHTAVQVKITVTPDASQVSYVNCEVCDQKWAAFGGNNTTRISLLSATTNDPDPINEEVRQNLIGIVRRATDGDALGGIAEKGSSPSVDDIADQAGTQEPLFTGHTAPEEASNSRSRSKTDPVPAHEIPGSLSRSRSGRIMGLVREKRESLRKGNWKRFIRRSNAPITPTRRVPNLTSQDRPEPDLLGRTTHQLPPQDARRPSDDIEPTFNCLESDLALPSTTSPEVASYLRSLDRTVLAGMNDEQRASWLRERYTEFRRRNRRSSGQLALSPVRGVIEQQPRMQRRVQTRRRTRQSMDLTGAGGVAEALRRIPTNSSIVAVDPRILELSEETLGSRHSGPGRVQRARRGFADQRPRSVPNGQRQSSISSQVQEPRASIDSMGWHTGDHSVSSSTAPPSVHTSIATTVCPSTSDRPESQASLYMMHEAMADELRTSHGPHV